MRPVNSTASGGNTTQKKYRSAFIFLSSPLVCAVERWAFSCPLRPPLFSTGNLQSPDLKANRDRDRAIAFQDHHFAHRYLSPCISQFYRCGLPECPGAAWHHALHYPEDRAP